jgi:23S rRNA (cytosine1962-C5)-methyltransferase
LKKIILKAKSLSRIKSCSKEFFLSDFEDISRAFVPGEWVYLADYKENVMAVGFINSFVMHGPAVRVTKFIRDELSNQNEFEVGKDIVLENIKAAICRRRIFSKYNEGSRLVFGNNDYLPGLIIDRYKNAILIQINTAGIDRYREEIKQELELMFENENVYFHDNQEYRKNEVLPEFKIDRFEQDLKITENQFNYSLPSRLIQKIGYYYDHRENRAKLETKLAELNIDKENALDLFSYIGSWGLHLLRSGVKHVTFVDQADMGDIVENNLQLNGLEGRGEFIRNDVFSYIGEQVSKGNKYNIIVSDPPAFSKNEKSKKKAIIGYEKLHTKLMQILQPKSVLVVASCTHYVSLEELDETVKKAALKVSRDMQILDLGVQGHDHVFSEIKDKSNYIKYILYYVE